MRATKQDALPDTRRLPLGFRIAKELKAHWVLYLMILPAVVYTVIFNYLPLQGVLIAFERFNLRQMEIKIL